MQLFQKKFKSNFLIRLTHWEYWPFGIVQFPAFIYWMWCALRERSLFFFSASNPSIYMGGMLGESKYEVLNLVPKEVKPITALVKLPASKIRILEIMEQHQLKFPVIFKPDLGERGWMVRRINHAEDIEQYLKEVKIDFLIQEWLNLPLEFGVFYVRYPNEPVGRVNSITMKEFLSVTGDGKKDLRTLMLEKDRARLQWPVLQKKYAGQLSTILEAGRKMELVSIGNHCLGTKFLDGNHLITPKLSASFDQISKQITGFYFGRFDLRCTSLEDLENGNIKIMELNGCGAEPAHIYHPGASLRKGIAVILKHWRDLYHISKLNHAHGVPYLSFREGYASYKKFRNLNTE